MEKVVADSRQSSWRSVVEYWGPVIIYAGLIFYFSAQPHPEEQLPDFLFKRFSDKLLHAVEFAVLAILCYRAFRWAAGPVAARQAVMLAIIVASGYAVSDEVHQLFVPSREASVLDWMADTAGAAIGSLGWSRFTSTATF